MALEYVWKEESLKLRKRVAFLLVAVAPFAMAQQKSDILMSRQSFRTLDLSTFRPEYGDIMRPGLYPEDREAIFDVQQGIRDWNHMVCNTAEDADLIFIVRKGRIAVGRGRIGVSGRFATSAGCSVAVQRSPSTDRNIGGARWEVWPPMTCCECSRKLPTGMLPAVVPGDEGWSG